MPEGDPSRRSVEFAAKTHYTVPEYANARFSLEICGRPTRQDRMFELEATSKLRSEEQSYEKLRALWHRLHRTQATRDD